jgi:hypothetical protein
MIHPEPAKGERAILRYADAGGRPFANLERCNRYARETIERETKAGLKIYDDREPLKPSRPPTESRRGS